MTETKLWEALDLLRRDGWVQKAGRSGAKRCAVAALCEVHNYTGGENVAFALDNTALTNAAMEQFPERICPGLTDNVVYFNDHYRTVFEDVELVYVKAATKRDEALA